MDSKIRLSSMQERFCVEYLKDFNATQAAIRAGYSKKTAHVQGPRLISSGYIQEVILENRQKVKKSNIMDAQEIQERLTKIARGEVKELLKDQIKALELLGKTNGLFVDKMLNLTAPIIVDDIPKETENDNE